MIVGHTSEPFHWEIHFLKVFQQKWFYNKYNGNCSNWQSFRNVRLLKVNKNN